jgi:hypothetical protein
MSPTLLPDLEAQLDAAARRTAPVSAVVVARRALLRPRRRTLVIALAIALLVASLAVAAVQLTGAGDPVPKTTGLGAPDSGAGRLVPGTVRLLDVRAADPDGGPPWGIRVFRTTRRAGCWQIGRVLNGRLGLLGRDGILHDDGLFHALPVQTGQCRPLDGAGHLFAFQNALALDNGVESRLTCRPVGFARDDRALPACPAGSGRLVLYGFLGPLARTVTLDRDGAPPATVAVGQDGAFAFALKVDNMVQGPRYTLTAAYADGASRPVDDVLPLESVPAPGPADPLPPGYVSPLHALPSPALVRAPLRVTHRRVGKNTIYTLRFRSRVSLERWGVDYSVRVTGPRAGSGRDCEHPMDGAFFGTGGDVRAGQLVTVKLTPGIAIRWGRGWCPGAYRVTVVLHDAAHPVGSFAFTAGGRGSR